MSVRKKCEQRLGKLEVYKYVFTRTKTLVSRARHTCERKRATFNDPCPTIAERALNGSRCVTLEFARRRRTLGELSKMYPAAYSSRSGERLWRRLGAAGERVASLPGCARCCLSRRLVRVGSEAHSVGRNTQANRELRLFPCVFVRM